MFEYFGSDVLGALQQLRCRWRRLQKRCGNPKSKSPLCDDCLGAMLALSFGPVGKVLRLPMDLEFRWRRFIRK